MEMSVKTRLVEEAKNLIEQSDLEDWEKDNLNNNIKYFFSRVSKDKYVEDCRWEWFDEEEEGRGLDLVWDWKDVKGCFGFYTNNGHGFNFEYGEHSEAFQFGGEDGEYGFSCGRFIDELENQLAYMGY